MGSPADWTILQAEVPDQAPTRDQRLAWPDPEPVVPLPNPTTFTPLPADWRDDAACKGMDTDVFFPPPKSIPGKKGWFTDYSEARIVCAKCPVRAECLDHALAIHERDGMWGGLSPRQRVDELTRRGGKRRRVCAICGCDFMANGTAKYCDDVCRETGRRRINMASKQRTA